jgi:hypothetical protein
MSRICWWLADIVSCTLQPDERDAIYGDFAESSETGRQALLDLVGLPVYMDIRTYWQYGVSYSSGLTAGEEIAMSLCSGLGLLVWSWISGFALGSLSRRTIWLTGSLYFLLWMFPYLTVFHFCWNLFWHGGLPRGSALPIILLMFVLQIALPAASVLAAVMVG